MASIMIEQDDMFLSHEVETLDIIKKRLEDDTQLKLRTNLNVDDIVDLLKFIITTTYFSFRGTIYQQKFGTVMGSPVSIVIANLFMEWLEEQAILTHKPTQWKRYVDDAMEVVRKGCEQELTEHLNSIDITGSIKFTCEDESDNSLSFLDTLVIPKEDGTVKLGRRHTQTNIRTSRLTMRLPETGGHQNVTASITCKLKLWKRYVDDAMEVVRKGYEQELTEHLDSIDNTGSIKFTYEEESENSLPFLDTLMIRKEDGTVKLLVYRKKTHTGQYLNFTSHHPLLQKLGSSKRYWIDATSYQSQRTERKR